MGLLVTLLVSALYCEFYASRSGLTKILDVAYLQPVNHILIKPSPVKSCPGWCSDGSRWRNLWKRICLKPLSVASNINQIVIAHKNSSRKCSGQRRHFQWQAYVIGHPTPSSKTLFAVKTSTVSFFFFAPERSSQSVFRRADGSTRRTRRIDISLKMEGLKLGKSLDTSLAGETSGMDHRLPHRQSPHS